MNPQEPIETTSTAAQSRCKITLFTPRQLAQKTGISLPAIRAAVRSGELRCLRVNQRVWKIESADAARWVELLATTQPGSYRKMRAQTNTTTHNFLA